MILKQYKTDIGLEVNNYLLIDENEKEAVLIDCTGSFKEVEQELKKYGANLKYILLTHGHFDHLYGLYEFKEKLNPIIVAHKDDKILIENVEVQCNLFGVSIPQKPIIDTYINENSNLDFGNYHIDIIYTPGHTQGGVCYLIDNKLFSGDTLFYESVGRCDLPGGDFNKLANSIIKELYTLDPKTEVYPGHGDSTTIGHEIENNFYVNDRS